MQTYSLPELLKLWTHEQLTNEQMIGQLLLHVTRLHNAVILLEKTLNLPTPPPVIIKRAKGKA